MRKTILSCLFIFFCVSLFAQEEVTFNFKRDKIKLGFQQVTVYVNGVEAGNVQNGSTFTYKTKLDVTKPITVLARIKASKIRQEITFTLSPGNKVEILTGFLSRDLILELQSGGIVTGGTNFVADLSNLTPTERSEALRQQWINKGGRLINESYMGSITYISLKESDMKLSGWGGQFTYTFNMLNFKVPEFKPGTQTWNSFVYGLSVNIQLYGATMKISGLEPIGMATYNPSISLNGGYTFGFGKFKDETIWKGVAFELTYKPSLIMSQTIIKGADKSETEFTLNMMGFGFDINFNSFSANALKLAPKSKSKFSFFILPPIKDMPLIVNIGYGRTFYRKAY